MFHLFNVIISYYYAQIVEKYNWFLISDEKRLEEMCLVIIDKNPELVSVYKKGKTKIINVLMKEMIKATEECGDMAAAARIMERLLKS